MPLAVRFRDPASGIVFGLLLAYGRLFAERVITLLVFASQGGAVALKVVIACVILQQIQDNFVHPKVMGGALELNPVLLFLALFIGERIDGLLGVFLSIPLPGMIAAWMRANEENATSALEDAADRPSDRLEIP